LLVPAGFEANDGVARVVESPAADGRTVPVTVNALDALLDDVPVSVLKLDVEGFEIHVLRGAARALASRRLTHIVFEDHEAPNSEVVRLLESAGYRIFALGWTMRGLTLSPADRGSLASPYEAPNYVATLDPDGVTRRCAPRGWRVLRRMARRA
jgi:hypothetical protein